MRSLQTRPQERAGPFGPAQLRGVANVRFAQDFDCGADRRSRPLGLSRRRPRHQDGRPWRLPRRLPQRLPRRVRRLPRRVPRSRLPPRRLGWRRYGWGPAVGVGLVGTTCIVYQPIYDDAGNYLGSNPVERLPVDVIGKAGGETKSAAGLNTTPASSRLLTAPCAGSQTRFDFFDSKLAAAGFSPELSLAAPAMNGVAQCSDF